MRKTLFTICIIMASGSLFQIGRILAPAGTISIDSDNVIKTVMVPLLCALIPIFMLRRSRYLLFGLMGWLGFVVYMMYGHVHTICIAVMDFSKISHTGYIRFWLWVGFEALVYLGAWIAIVFLYFKILLQQTRSEAVRAGSIGAE